MKTFLPTVRWCCLTIIFSAFFILSSHAQTLTSDAADYLPGSTIVLTGSGFQAGETVTMQVLHNPTCCDDATAADHMPWTINADGDGSFVTSWFVDADEYGASLIATADGQSSGNHAFALFTDGGNVLEKAAPTDQNQVDVPCGETVTLYVHVSTSNQDGTGVPGVALQWNLLESNGHPLHVSFLGTPDAQTDADGNASATVQDNGVYANGNPGNVECVAPTLGNGNGENVTWHVSTDCQLVTPPPVLTCASGSDLGCYGTSDLIASPAPVAPSVSGGCAPVGTPTFSDGVAISTGGCGWSITRTWSVIDACNDTATCDQVYTYSQADALAWDNLPEGNDLGCNPSELPSCATVTATNQCGTVNATCSDGGVQTVGSCGRSQTFHYHAEASCGGTLDTDVIYTWNEVTTPVISGCPTGGDLGCNPERLPSCDNSVSASNECGAVTVVCTPGTETVNGCQHSLDFTYTATDDCSGLSAIPCIVSYTWNIVTAPVISGCPVGGNLGCNPIAPSCDNNVSASNECGAVTVVCTPGTENINGCVHTQDFTYTATDECSSLSATPCVVSYTWNVVTTPVFDNLPTAGGQGCQSLSYSPPSCNTQAITAHNECGTVSANCSADAVVSSGCNRSQTFHYSATDECSGLTGTDSRTFTWSVPTTLSLSAPNPLPVCGLGGNSLTVSVTGTGTIVSFSWTVSGAGWSINTGNTPPGSATITYTAGNSGTQGTFTVTATNSCGCTSTATVTFGSRCQEACGYSQGFYGGTGKNCQQQQGPAVIASTLSAYGPLMTGTTGHSITFGTTAAEASCLAGKMPAGTSPSQLPGNNIASCSAIPNNNQYINSGKFKDNLLGQVIALWMNIHNGSALGSLVISGPYLTFYKATMCTNGVAIAGTKTVKGPIPNSIFSHLGSSFTVNQLWTEANTVLGNGGPNSYINDINSALSILNTAFDGCRIYAGSSTSSAGVRPELLESPATTESSIDVKVFPNPSAGITTVQFNPVAGGNAVIEVFSLNGAKVATLLNKEVVAGEEYSVDFNTSSWVDGVYFVRTTTGNEAAFSKLIIMKK